MRLGSDCAQTMNKTVLIQVGNSYTMDSPDVGLYLSAFATTLLPLLSYHLDSHRQMPTLDESIMQGVSHCIQQSDKRCGGVATWDHARVLRAFCSL